MLFNYIPVHLVKEVSIPALGSYQAYYWAKYCTRVLLIGLIIIQQEAMSNSAASGFNYRDIIRYNNDLINVFRLLLFADSHNKFKDILFNLKSSVDPKYIRHPLSDNSRRWLGKIYKISLVEWNELNMFVNSSKIIHEVMNDFTSMAESVIPTNGAWGVPLDLDRSLWLEGKLGSDGSRLFDDAELRRLRTVTKEIYKLCQGHLHKGELFLPYSEKNPFTLLLKEEYPTLSEFFQTNSGEITNFELYSSCLQLKLELAAAASALSGMNSSVDRFGIFTDYTNLRLGTLEVSLTSISTRFTYKHYKGAKTVNFPFRSDSLALYQSWSNVKPLVDLDPLVYYSHSKITALLIT